MLESYCAALGIELFNPDFYREESLSHHIKRKTAHGGHLTAIVVVSLRTARCSSHLHTEIFSSADRIADRRPVLSTLRF
jgi:hypothetical protein